MAIFRRSSRRQDRPGTPAPAQSAARGARLLWLAEPALTLITRLRATTSVPDLARLREHIADMLLDFQAAGHSQGLDSGRMMQASEALRALIDQVVTSMPWGVDAGWKSLASSTVSGGRRPAQRLLDSTRAASSDAGMQELIGVGVSLGFDQRAGGMDDPYVDQLLALLATPGQNPGLHEEGLSPQARSNIATATPTGWLPLWVSSLVVAAALAALFFALEVSLGMRSDRIYARMAAMSVPEPAARGQPAPNPRLAGGLAGQIAARNLTVTDEIDRSVVVVPGSQLFQPGEATLQPGSTQLLKPIAAVLQQTPGRIRVIGHTEGSIGRSARYPSDWEFSLDRARVVQNALRDFGVDAARLTYDGRANVEPLARAAGSGGPGTDGRIEIVLLAGR